MANQADSQKSSKAVMGSEPTAADDLIESGWAHYSKKEYYRAEADFQKAKEIDPGNPDTLYALGMTQQASGRQNEAIQTFQKVIELLKQPGFSDSVRAHMLSRLAQGHINRMRTGDWGLDK